MLHVVSVFLFVLGAFSSAHAVTPNESHSATTLATSSVSAKVAPVTVETVPVTFSDNPDSVRFAVIGDSGTGDSAQYDMGREMQAIHQTTDFGFVVMLGDNIYGGHSSNDFQKKFALPYKPLLDEGVKFYATLGNHDNTDEVSYAPFNMEGHRYYTFTKSNIQFFVLDSNFMSADQLTWLRNELQKSTAEWKIAYFHHPLYSDGKRHGSDTDLRAVLEPVFEQYGVNVVLSGHDHVYERTTPQNGILYFVLGSSGKLRDGGLKKAADEAAGFDQDRCFMVMQVAGNQLYFKTISRSGQIVDSGIAKRQTPAITATAATTSVIRQAESH